MTAAERLFKGGIQVMSDHIHEINVAHGFWEKERNDSEAIMLVVTELAEAVEWIRKGNPASDHIEKFSGLEEELADAIIRILDYGAGRKLKIAEALIAKVRFNATRPHKHKKKF